MPFLKKYTNMKFMNLTGEWQKPNLGPGEGGGGLFLGILGGVCRPVLQIRPKNVIFHTRFQTRPLKSIPVFTPGYVIII